MIINKALSSSEPSRGATRVSAEAESSTPEKFSTEFRNALNLLHYDKEVAAKITRNGNDDIATSRNKVMRLNETNSSDC